jgi:ribonuclease P protein component
MPAMNETTVPAPSFSFPRERRLRLKREFAHVFSAGRRAHGRHLALVAVRNAAGGCFKAGVVARKREYRQAVDRNHAKRRMRELVRLNQHALQPDAWLVVRAHAGVDRAPWDVLQNEFMQLCRTVGICLDEHGDEGDVGT